MASTITAMPARISAEEWQTRCDLAACYRLVDLFGWSDLINTRVTARAPDREDHFLINRYGLLFDEIAASSLVKIDRAGNQVEPSEYAVNSAGFAIPSAIHMARPEIACVLHTHSIAGCAVSMQKDGLLPLNQHALQVIGDVAYHSYEGAARSPEERQRLLADLADRHIMVLRNHGLLVVGNSIAAACIATYRMERACAMQLAFPAVGGRVSPDRRRCRQCRLRQCRASFGRYWPQRSGEVRMARAATQARPHRPFLQAIAAPVYMADLAAEHLALRQASRMAFLDPRYRSAPPYCACHTGSANVF